MKHHVAKKHVAKKHVAVFCLVMLALSSCGASQTTLTSVDNASSTTESGSDSTDSTVTSPPTTVPTTTVPTVTSPTAVPDAVESAADAVEAADSASGESRSGAEFTDAEVECLSDAGYDPIDLIEAGIAASSGQVGDEEEQIYNELFECAPEWALSDAFVVEFAAGLSEGSAAQVSDGEGRCVVQRLIDNGSGGSVLFGREPFVALEIFEACLTEENAAEILGGEGTGPLTYGDDPSFDVLQDRCVGDDELNDIACDVLYSITSVNSDYEAVALTCGNRDPFSDLSCADDMVDNNNDLFIDPDSAGIPPIEDACRAGEMIACDYLYSLTEFGSTTEQLGGTCGDRGGFDGTTLCVERFGENAG